MKFPRILLYLASSTTLLAFLFQTFLFSHGAYGNFIYLSELCQCDHSQEPHQHTPKVNQEDFWFQKFLNISNSIHSHGIENEDDICHHYSIAIETKHQNTPNIEPHLCPHKKSKRILETNLITIFTLFFLHNHSNGLVPNFQVLGIINTIYSHPKTLLSNSLIKPPELFTLTS